ncbi:MAG TPA: isoaspartyl peptidase/L-asparaginase, partial [Cyclobacteriaceae bacterium]|nr:isoaspartyl peptidase/L-asparaginase [Cyclobacteriaceae bacterium]
MVGRRKFIKKSLLSGTFLLPGTLEAVIKDSSPAYRPLILSTWKHGMPANDRAWDTLNATGNILDAVEQGVRVTESDPSNLSVGLQGLPDREGVVTLDASIMKGDGSCGSV